MPRERQFLFGLVLFLMLAALWPIKSLSAPEWNVWVVDESGNPISGALVREDCQNYYAESTSHEEDMRTDAAGHVKFPPKSINISLLRRFIASARSATAGIHASFGPSAYVIVFIAGYSGDDVRDGNIYSWKGAPEAVASRIVMHAN